MLSYSLTPANRKTPSTEKIYKNRRSKPPIFDRAGITTIIVSNIILIYLACFMYLKILDMRIALMKVVDDPKSAFNAIDTEVEIVEAATITKSNVLPESLKYARNPKAKSFKKDSIANIIAKE